MYRLKDCNDCDGVSCVGRTYAIAPLGYREWPACPVSLLRSGPWQYVVRLSNAKLSNPLSEWPFRYAAWVVDAMDALKEALHKKEIAAAKKSQLKPPKRKGRTIGPRR